MAGPSGKKGVPPRPPKRRTGNSMTRTTGKISGNSMTRKTGKISR